MKYDVNEIFYSLQGEGIWTGTPAVFIRFAGCNLKCSFCDTKHESFTAMTEDDILKSLDKYSCDRVILTGGEPLLQVDMHLISALKEAWKIIHIETNGTVPLTRTTIRAIDFLTVSPKTSGLGWVLRSGDEIKIVYQGQDLAPFELTTFKNWLLQPCSEQNISEVIEVCKKNPRWRMSLQTQKMVKMQ